MGKAYIHTIIDDHSRVVCAEIHDDGAYRVHLWRDTCADLGIVHKRTRPYRPQTNGKVERFHRTLADDWAHARCYTSEAERCGELDG